MNATPFVEKPATSWHLDRAQRYLAECDEEMGPIAKPETVKICLWVRTPSGERIQCEVLSTSYSPHTFFEQAYVRALHGTPFNGQRCAVVPMTGNMSAVRVHEKKVTS